MWVTFVSVQCVTCTPATQLVCLGGFFFGSPRWIVIILGNSVDLSSPSGCQWRPALLIHLTDYQNFDVLRAPEQAQSRERFNRSSKQSPLFKSPLDDGLKKRTLELLWEKPWMETKEALQPPFHSPASQNQSASAPRSLFLAIKNNYILWTDRQTDGRCTDGSRYLSLLWKLRSRWRVRKTVGNCWNNREIHQFRPIRYFCSQ